MIRVNMLRNLGMQNAAVGGGLGSAGAGSETVASPEANKQAVTKLIVIAVFPLLLFAFEKINIAALEGQLKKNQQEVEKLNAEKTSFGSVAPRVDKYTKEKKEIETQVESVRELTKNRLREVKTLDLLQSLVPEQTWLKEVQIDAGIVKIEGFTSSDDGVSKLIKALEGTVLFSQIVPKSTTRVELANGPAKRFEMEFKVGKMQ